MKERKSIYEKVCNICGTINCTNEFCKDKSILQRINNLIKHFGFDKNKLGTIEVFDEWNRIKNILEDMYNIADMENGIFNSLFR